MTISNSTKVRPLRDKGLGLIITTVHFCRTFATYAYHEVILKVHQFGGITNSHCHSLLIVCDYVFDW
jgi:hypothetical protein